ncbi:Endo-1,3-beta-glucanase [Golovinomyces cichoracearum]|uniref:Endo-1,3-beta-glucanase n=1 Tax=Golovinomyces cichoracearum TaxID=62708 RepID=A0A420I9T3_9PEZI|nr:Endo-1,3-beta-glucanase [Golovinomyces cichoracearum]
MFVLSLTSLWAFLFAYKVSTSYVLSPDDVYQGNTFFDKFDFFTEIDPNLGFVQYEDRNTASNSKLINVNDAQQVYIGVDYQNTYNVNDARGRPSIRLETKKTYQYGLFVFDLSHMPANTCGKWSAFWTTNRQDWPRWGEIDIIENIHESNVTMEALHTSPGCSLAGNQISNQMTGRQKTYNCDGAATSSSYGPQSSGQGCVAENTNPNSYGTSFNEVGGGVYVMEWNNQAIKIWQFRHENVPQDLSAGSPNPSGWEKPVFSSAQGDCNIDEHFKDQRVIIDSAFCGNWAGQDVFWKETSCYKSDPAKYPTCNSYVANNPGAYKESYWLINSLKVYQNSATASMPKSQIAGPSDSEPSRNQTQEIGLSSDASSSTTEIQDSQPQIYTSLVATQASSSTSLQKDYPSTLSRIASASGIPPYCANDSYTTYWASATGSAAVPVESAYLTQTMTPVEVSGDTFAASPTSREETGGGLRAAFVSKSSTLALIFALVLGMIN